MKRLKIGYVLPLSKLPRKLILTYSSWETSICLLVQHNTLLEQYKLTFQFLFVDPEMGRDLMLWLLAITLVTLTAGKPRRKRDYVSGTADSPKPCQIQLVGSQLRCAVPSGYNVRRGDCPGNDIGALYRDRTTLKQCAQLCSSSSKCQAFMFYNNHRCYPKTKTCGTTTKSNPLNVFYDKVPSGYTMRPGNCPGNDVWNLYRGRATRQECAKICDSSSTCNAFMHYDNHRCYLKCDNSLNVFYDKVPDGYALRPGDCSGNDIWKIHGFVSLSECANRCNSDSRCVSFMYFDNKECYPKTRTCAKPSTANPKNVFYDKIPSGYAMRPGDCPGNDIWSIHGFVSLAECARRCNSNPRCVSFMFYDGRECYPKTKTCLTTDKRNAKNFFYDKIVIIWSCDADIPR